MSKTWKVLLVDDDPLISDSLQMILPDTWNLTTCQTIEHIPQENFQAAFVDMHLTGHGRAPEGLDVIKSLSQKHPHLEIIAISGDLNRKLMEQCLKVGATRFLAKPFSKEEIKAVLDKIEALHLLHQVAFRQTKKKYWLGTSTSAQNLKKQVAHLRGEPGPILIEGESGTGKEITVQMIADQDSGRPFVAVNIAAISETLFESELFGHVKGSFTGADQNKMGLAEAANNGDLFLDEIEALTLACQVKLLRFLETNEIRRVGSKDSSQINVRVIAATNQNLEKLVKEGKFREDLLWRISGKKIMLPPLRERKEDIPELAKFLLEQQKPRYNKTLSEDALALLKTHSWPGNIRELRRVIEQACLSSPLPFIRAEDFSSFLSRQSPISANQPEGTPNYSLGLNKLVEDYEKIIIEKCLSQEKDIDKVAEVLSISRSGLYKKIKDYNIDTKGI
ncbi:MAG: sigma-54 dependent transcriptional regulator [Bdellovibrionota bacterium]